jgi:hypothetical protein
VTNSDGASPARQAVDGNPATRWSSGRAQSSASDAFTVGFGATVKISSLTINNSNDNSANDFPASYALYGSTDGTSFSGTPFATGSGSAGTFTMTFSQQTLKAVKIQETGSSSTSWFSIGELSAACTE